jgi:tetratricopeptide (TPR) repeat protein
MICGSARQAFLICVLAFSVPLGIAQPQNAQIQTAEDSIPRIAAALRSGDFRSALRLTQSALAQRPNDCRIWTLRGMAIAGTGNLPDALLAYQHALKLVPGYLPALEGAAQTEFQLGRDGAKPLLLQILAQRPGDPASLTLLGIFEYRKKNCAVAIEYFRQAAPVINEQPEALTDYGLCLAQENRNDDAVAAFAKVVALTPGKSEARYDLALAQWRANRPDDALATLQPMIETDPVNADASTLAADIVESKGDTAQAVQLLRKAILVNPRNVETYLQFAALSFDHASPKVGIDIINFGLTQLPREPRLYLVRGVLLTQFGEFNRAADDFEMASRLDPSLQFLGIAEGLVKSQQHKSAEALATFRAAVKAHPNEAYAHYLLAEALMQEGKPDGSPEYKEEVEAATRAVKLDPSLVAAQDLLSTVYMQNGHTQQAIEHSRAALALDPNDQQALYHLIVALRKTDEKDEIPALLKRLVKLRAESNAQVKSPKGYRLYDGAEAGTAKTP